MLFSTTKIRRLALLAAAVVAIGFTTPTAEARPRPKKGGDFEANKGFGLGIMLGAPTALAFKYYLGKDTAIDGGIGVVGRYRGRDGLHVHLDYLWHPVTLIKTEPFWMPLYLGIGARLFDFDDRDDDHGTGIGARLPVGLLFDFNNVPIDIFLEGALVVDLLVGYRDRTYVDFNVAVGLRYYFN